MASVRMDLARTAAAVVLENGGEIYRVEDTVRRLLSTIDARVDVLALPTGVFLSIETDEGLESAVLRVTTRTMNLSRLHAANRISRAMVCGELTAEQALERMRALQAPDRAPLWKNLLAAGVSAACFAILFGGGVPEFLLAMLDGIAVEWLAHKLSGEDYFLFISRLLGGVLAAFIALGGSLLVPGLGQQAVIAGSIFPMLPGLTMTNAIRDIMRGDLVSGIARLGEVFLVALSLAGGIYVALKLWQMGGGLFGMG